MIEQDLIVETDTRPAPEADDERRRYYRSRRSGRAAARAEAERLSGLVRTRPRQRPAPQEGVSDAVVSNHPAPLPRSFRESYGRVSSKPSRAPRP